MEHADSYRIVFFISLPFYDTNLYTMKSLFNDSYLFFG
jgi:hypothetical protein